MNTTSARGVQAGMSAAARVRLGTPLLHPCPECGARMVLRDSKFGLFYGCASYPRCKATHGAHKATGQPLGIPADGPTKLERMTSSTGCGRAKRRGSADTRRMR